MTSDISRHDLEVPVLGWVPAWHEDGGFVVGRVAHADREDAEIEACGAAIDGSTCTLVVPAYDWEYLHPLLSYRVK